MASAHPLDPREVLTDKLVRIRQFAGSEAWADIREFLQDERYMPAVRSALGAYPPSLAGPEVQFGMAATLERTQLLAELLELPEVMAQHYAEKLTEMEDAHD